MTGPDDGAMAGRGHLRAAYTDREHVIALLKAAFVQGRLDKDELDARVGQVLAARTYAELAAITEDLPAEPPGAKPISQPLRTLATAARRSGICALLTVALIEGAFLANSFALLCLATFAFIATVGFMGYGFVDAWEQRKARGEPPSPPDQGHPGLDPRRPAPPGSDPAPPSTHTDHTRADLRADQTPADQRPDQTRADLRPGQTPAAQRTDQTRADQTRADQHADQTRADQRADQTRADQHADQTRADQHADQTHPDQRTRQSGPGCRYPTRRVLPVPLGM
jgi:Domain of unknown function (DUF1707)